MRTSKITLLAILLSLFSYSAKAQIYINVGVGYGLPAFRDLLQIDYTSTTSTATYTGEYSSLGKGIIPELTIGYKANEHLGIEVGYSYLLGMKTVGDINDGSNNGFTEKGTDEISARLSRVLIGGRVSFGDNDFSPYMRMGIVLGLGAKVTDTYNTTTTGPSFSSTTNRVVEYTGGMAAGYSTGIGFSYHISEKFGFYVEWAMTAQQYAPMHSEIVTYEVDGQDQLGSMNVRQKQTDYVDTYDDNGSPNNGEPDKNLKFYFPMSSWGLAAGLHFYFGQ